MLVSVVAIFLALVFQFRNAVKPLVVFSAIPFGVVGALVSLIVMGAPFGFMAFLGVASLIGVIVSHVIVLFDFIEEMHAEGEPLRDALLDAGIVRLRPVIITVGATVFGLIPLALHGGPLWEGAVLHADRRPDGRDLRHADPGARCSTRSSCSICGSSNGKRRTNVRRATCNVRRATCDVQRATCEGPERQL